MNHFLKQFVMQVIGHVQMMNSNAILDTLLVLVQPGFVMEMNNAQMAVMRSPVVTLILSSKLILASYILTPFV